LPRPRTSTADLGGRSDTLKPLPWTAQQRVAFELAARRYVERKMGNDPGLLEMLGLKPYESGRPPMNKAPTHGRRSTYTNHGCRCIPCTTANNEYHRKQEAA
jgi:hypothetical protein